MHSVNVNKLYSNCERRVNKTPGSLLTKLRTGQNQMLTLANCRNGANERNSWAAGQMWASLLDAFACKRKPPERSALLRCDALDVGPKNTAEQVWLIQRTNLARHFKYPAGS